MPSRCTYLDFPTPQFSAPATDTRRSRHESKTMGRLQVLSVPSKLFMPWACRGELSSHGAASVIRLVRVTARNFCSVSDCTRLQLSAHGLGIRPRSCLFACKDSKGRVTPLRRASTFEILALLSNHPNPPLVMPLHRLLIRTHFIHSALAQSWKPYPC